MGGFVTLSARASKCRVIPSCAIRSSNLTLYLFDVDAHSVAIDRTMRLEVEDTCERVASYRLLVHRAFNHVNSIFPRFVPLIREVRIFPLPAISRLARDPGSFTSVKKPYPALLSHLSRIAARV